jgi:hypothetical protein
MRAYQEAREIIKLDPTEKKGPTVENHQVCCRSVRGHDERVGAWVHGRVGAIWAREAVVSE